MTKRSAWRPPPLPHEHGAWVMLAIPLSFGIAASGRPRLPALLLVPAMAALFLARYAAAPALGRIARGKGTSSEFLRRRLGWAAAYAVAGVACLSAVVARLDRGAGAALLVAASIPAGLGLAHFVLTLLGAEKTLPGEILGIAGLASLSPLAVAASGRPVDGRAWGLALLCLAYFVSTLVFVRAFRRLPTGPRAAAASCALAHLGLFSALIALWRIGWLPGGGVLAFLPVLGRVAWGLLRPPASVRALGWREAAVAAAFALVGATSLIL